MRKSLLLLVLCAPGCAGLREFVTKHEPEIVAAKAAAESAAVPASGVSPVAGGVLGAVALGLGALLRFGAKRQEPPVA